MYHLSMLVSVKESLLSAVSAVNRQNNLAQTSLTKIFPSEEKFGLSQHQE